MLRRLLRRLLGGGRPARNRRRHEPRPGRPFPVRVISVQDGDSLVLRPSQSGGDERFRARLYAIDAPEHDQPHGEAARDYLRRLVWNRDDLIMEAMDTDQYGRLVGVLYYRAMDRRRSINRLMVEQGLARWYSRYGGHGLGLEQAERDARRRRRGVWSGRHQVTPWDHRRAQRSQGERPGCLKLLLLAAAVSAAVSIAVAVMAKLA